MADSVYYDSILKDTWTKNAQGLWVHPITKIPVTQEQYLQQAYTDDANAIRADQAKTQAVKQYFASPRTAEQAFLYAAQYGLTASDIKNRLGTSNDTVDLLGSLEALNINYQNPADGSAVPKQDMTYFLAKKFDELGIKKVSDLSKRTDVVFNDNFGTTAKLTGNSSNPIAFNIDYPTKLGKQLAAAGLIDPSSSGGAWTTQSGKSSGSGFGVEGMLSQIGQRLYNQTGITDINDLEQVTKDVPITYPVVLYYDGEYGNATYYKWNEDNLERLTSEEIRNLRSVRSHDSELGYYDQYFLDTTVKETAIYNKKTGQEIPGSKSLINFGGSGNDLKINLGGWGEGPGMTYASIRFGANGKPYLRTTGEDSSDLGSILPFIAFASFMIPGGPAAVGSFITGGAATGTAAALIGSAAINFATNVALGASPIDALKNTVKSVGASYVGNMVGAMLPTELQAVGSSAVSQLIQTGKIDLTTLAIAGAQGVVANTLSSELGISKDVASSLANAGLNAIAGRESAAISSLANAGVRSAINNFAQDSGLTTEQKNFLALGVGQAIQTAKTGKFNPVALLNSLAATGLSNAAAAAVVGEQAQGNVFKDKNGNSYVADDEGNRLIISGSSAGTVLNPEQVAISDGWSGTAERNAAISKFGLNATPAQYKDYQSAISQGWSGTEQRNAAQATLGSNVTPAAWQEYSLAKDEAEAIKQGWTDAASRNAAVSILGSDASPSVWNKLKSWFNAPTGQDNLANTFKSSFGKAGSTDQFYEFGLDPTEFSRIDTIDDALKAGQSAFVSDAINAFAKGQMTEQDLRSELSAGGISAVNVNTLVDVAKGALTKQDKTNAIIRELLDPGSDLSLESAAQRLKSEVGLSDSQVGSLVQGITSSFARTAEVRQSANQVFNDYAAVGSDLSREGALERLRALGINESYANTYISNIDKQITARNDYANVSRDFVQGDATEAQLRDAMEAAGIRGDAADDQLTYYRAVKAGDELTSSEATQAAVSGLRQWQVIDRKGTQISWTQNPEDGTYYVNSARDGTGKDITDTFLGATPQSIDKYRIEQQQQYVDRLNKQLTNTAEKFFAPGSTMTEAQAINLLKQNDGMTDAMARQVVTGWNDQKAAILNNQVTIDYNKQTTNRMLSFEEFESLLGRANIKDDLLTRYRAYQYVQGALYNSGKIKEGENPLPGEISNLLDKAKPAAELPKNEFIENVGKVVQEGIAAGYKAGNPVTNFINSLNANLIGFLPRAGAGLVTDFTKDAANDVAVALRGIADIASTASDNLMPDLAAEARQRIENISKADGWGKFSEAWKWGIGSPASLAWAVSKELSEDLVFGYALLGKALKVVGNTPGQALGLVMTDLAFNYGSIVEDNVAQLTKEGLDPRTAAIVAGEGAMPAAMAETLVGMTLAKLPLEQKNIFKQLLTSPVRGTRDGFEELSNYAGNQLGMGRDLTFNDGLTAFVIGQTIGTKADIQVSVASLLTPEGQGQLIKNLDSLGYQVDIDPSLIPESVKGTITKIVGDTAIVTGPNNQTYVLDISNQNLAKGSVLNIDGFDTTPVQLTSDQMDTLLSTIDGAFQNQIGRPATYGEISSNIQGVVGKSQSELETLLNTTAEGKNFDLVNTLYQTNLRRDPTKAELTKALNDLNTGKITGDDLTTTIKDTKEYKDAEISISISISNQIAADAARAVSISRSISQSTSLSISTKEAQEEAARRAAEEARAEAERVSISNSISLSQAVAEAAEKERLRIEAERISISESISLSNAVSLSESTSMSLSKAVQEEAEREAARISVSKSVSLSEAAAKVEAERISVSNSISLSESISASISASISMSPSISQEKSRSQSISISQSEVSESISISQKIAENTLKAVSVSKSISVSQSISKSVSTSQLISNSISASISEEISRDIRENTNASISNSISESIAMNSSASISISKSASISERLKVLDENQRISLSNSISISDSLSQSASISVSESASVALSQKISQSVSESVTQSISQTVSINPSVSVSPTVSIATSQSVSVAPEVSVSQSISESISTTISQLVQASSTTISQLVQASESKTVSITFSPTLVITTPTPTVTVTETVEITTPKPTIPWPPTLSITETEPVTTVPVTTVTTTKPVTTKPVTTKPVTTKLVTTPPPPFPLFMFPGYDQTKRYIDYAQPNVPPPEFGPYDLFKAPNYLRPLQDSGNFGIAALVGAFNNDGKPGNGGNQPK